MHYVRSRLTNGRIDKNKFFVIIILISFTRRSLIMYCSNCGQQLDDDAKTCPNCNTPVKKIYRTSDLPAHRLAWISFFLWIGSEAFFMLAGLLAAATRDSGNYAIFSAIMNVLIAAPMLTLSIIAVLNAKKQTYDKTARVLMYAVLAISCVYAFGAIISVFSLGLL